MQSWRSSLSRQVQTVIQTDDKKPYSELSFTTCDGGLNFCRGIIDVNIHERNTSQDLRKPNNLLFVEKTKGAFVNVAVVGHSTRACFPLPDPLRNDFLAALKGSSAVFRDGANSAQTQGRVVCGSGLITNPKAVTDRDFMHEARIILRKPVEDSPGLHAIRYHMVTKRFSLAKQITYQPKSKDVWVVFQQFLLARDGKQGWSGVLNALSYAPQQADSEASPLESLAPTVQASTLVLKEMCEDSTKKGQVRAAIVETLKCVVGGTGWLTLGALADWFSTGRKLLIRPQGVSMPLSPTIPRMGRQWLVAIEQLFHQGGLVDSENQKCYLQMVVQQLQQSKLFFRRNSSHVLGLLVHEDSSLKSTLKDLFVVCKSAHVALRNTLREDLIANWLGCFDVVAWKAIVDKEHSSFLTNDLDWRSAEDRLMGFYSKICDFLELPEHRGLFRRFTSLAVQEYKEMAKNQRKGWIADLGEMRLALKSVFWKLGGEVGKLVVREKLVKVIAHAFVYGRSIADDERELGSLAKKNRASPGCHVETLRDSIVVQKYGPKGKAELVDPDTNQPTPFLLHCVPKWERYFGKRFRVTTAHTPPAKVRPEHCSKSVRIKHIAMLQRLILQKHRSLRARKTIVGHSLSYFVEKIIGEASLTDGQTKYIAYCQGVKGKIKYRQQDIKAGGVPYASELQQQANQIEKQENVKKQDMTKTWSEVAKEDSVFVPRGLLAVGEGVPCGFCRKPLLEASILLIIDMKFAALKPGDVAVSTGFWAMICGRRVTTLAFLRAERAKRKEIASIKYKAANAQQKCLWLTDRFLGENEKFVEMFKKVLIGECYGSKWTQLSEMEYTHWMATPRLKSKCVKIDTLADLQHHVVNIHSVDVRHSTLPTFQESRVLWAHHGLRFGGQSRGL